MKTALILDPTLAPQVSSKCPVTRTKIFLKNILEAFTPKSKVSGNTDKSTPTGRCPLGFDQPNTATTSVFIEKASSEAATAHLVEGDPEAARLLQEARSAIYHWPQNFPGFSCELEVVSGETTCKGSLRAVSSRSYEIKLTGSEPTKWLRFQIEEFLAHREHPNVSRMASRTGVNFGDNDLMYGRQINFLGDPMNSFYRIRDKKLTMIGRSYGKQTFVITIDDHLDCGGTFASTRYTAYYRDKESNLPLRSESFSDDYINVDGNFLPQERRYVEVNKEGLISRAIRFSQHQIISHS